VQQPRAEAKTFSPAHELEILTEAIDAHSRSGGRWQNPALGGWLQVLRRMSDLNIFILLRASLLRGCCLLLFWRRARTVHEQHPPFGTPFCKGGGRPPSPVASIPNLSSTQKQISILIKSDKPLL